MSQEYTEDKDVSLQPMSSGRRLLEALLIIVALLAVYLMVALVSFNPSDPSWSQTAWHEPIHNLGGGVGAWLADTLFFIFGVMAYVIPPVILGFYWIVFRQCNMQEYIDYFAVALRLIGVLALVVTTCGLAALNADDIGYFASGGVIGSLLSNAMSPWFSGPGGTLTLLFIWAAGLTLYTGWSWLIIAEKIGSVVMVILTFASNRSRKDDRWQEEEYQNDEYEEEWYKRSASSESLPHPSDESDDVLLSAPKKARHEIIQHNNEDDAPFLAMPPASVRAGEDSKIVPQPVSLSARPTPPVMAASADAQGQTTIPQPLQTASIPDKNALAEWSEFTVPEEVPAISLPQVGQDDAPSMGNWRDVSLSCDFSSQDVSQPEDVKPAEIPAAMPFMPGLTAASGSVNTQVKQGAGPELPRPNPVRLPTRRELASWGIKLPSQRMAEEKAKEDALRQQRDLSQPSAETDEGAEESEQAQLREAFLAEQQDRYGEKFADDADEEREQAELARQFSAQQEQRYQYTQEPEEGPTFQLNTAGTFDFSPMNDLVDDGQGEPLFTPSEIVESQDTVWQQPAIPPQQISSVEQQQTVITAQPEASAQSVADSLFHPFLVRHEQPLERPTTPLPTLDLLSAPPAEAEPVDMFALEQTARLVEARLADYRVKAEVVGISPGPVITRFELDLAPGVKAARISNLSRDLARSLSAVAVRVVEVIPGKPYVGLELPNKRRQTVYMREVLECDKFRDNPSPLSVVLGKDIAGQPVVADLAKMPHLLVAGTTGSGKSVGVNAMIISMLYKATPEDVRFIMIDPKMLELSVYEGIPHLLTEVVTDMKDAANALRWSVGEMERRYKLMSALGVRNLAGYNEKIAQAAAMGRPIPDRFWKPGDSMDSIPPVLEKLPFIVVLVDEFADLMMAVGKKVEELIARLAQKARAAGIHLVLATQRPSVDVITGLIKANIPTRIAFTVSSKIDSRTILDQGGAESLLGMGDMLYMPPNSSMPVRVHGAFVRDQEVHAVVQDWKARGLPQYIDSITAGEESEGGAAGMDGDEELDPLFDQAVGFVVEKRRASISGVQRQFRIGYNRAARIIEQMEAQGIVSSPGHNGNREVLSPPPHEM